MRLRCPTNRVGLIAALVFVGLAADARGGFAQAPVTYRVSVPEPEHHWMQVEVVFPELGAAALEARMSRSSPGRYALHEFARNVYDVKAFNGAGLELRAERPHPSGWDVAGHDGTVRVTYKVYVIAPTARTLDIDTSHAHINIPAALMGSRRLENRDCVTFAGPRRDALGTSQLHPTADPSRSRRRTSMPDGRSRRAQRLYVSTFQVTACGSPLRRCARRPSRSPTCGTAVRRRSFAADVRGIAERLPSSASSRSTRRGIHVSRRLSPVCRAGWDGAPEQHGPHVQRSSVIPDQRGDLVEHRSARVLPLVERRADPAALARALQPRRREHVRRAVARRRGHELL